MILYDILFIRDHLIYIQQTINYLKEGKHVRELGCDQILCLMSFDEAS
jgi:hypothetical protein